MTWGYWRYERIPTVATTVTRWAWVYYHPGGWREIYD